MRRALLALAVAVMAVAAPAAAAQAPDYTIRATGSKSGLGKVTGIGAFNPDRDPSLAAASAVFGPPSSKREGRSSCQVGWRPIGLRILFSNFGGGGACELGKAQSVAAFGSVWRTSRGLKINDSTRRLRSLYRGAYRKGRTYRLIGAKSIFTDGSRYSVLAAKTNGKKVKAFKLFVGAAGE